MASRIAMVAADPGGGRMLLPLARELALRGHAIHVAVSGGSVDIFSPPPVGVKVCVVEDGLGKWAASQVLPGADLLLSAAGVYNRLEHDVRSMARQRGVRIVTLLDHWNEVAARFSRTGSSGIEIILPDTALVPEARCAAAAVAAGLAPENVKVVGFINMEDSLNRIIREEPNRMALRTGLGASHDEILIIFFSEPYWLQPHGQLSTGVGGAVTNDGASKYGYWPNEVLEAVIRALNYSAATRRCRVRLLIKPHPREFPLPLQVVVDQAEPGPVTAVLTLDPPAQLISVADAVLGMSSVALLEAALAGRPTVSVQIGLSVSGVEDPCMASVLGYASQAYNLSALDSYVSAVLEGTYVHPKTLCPLSIDGSVTRTVKAVEELLNKSVFYGDQV